MLNLNDVNQAALLRRYNDEYRQKFNKELFVRSEDDIIEELKRVILSCQRDRYFTIKVQEFKVIDDYKQINDILYNYEKALIRNKKKDNQYEFINLKDSDIKLLSVKYFIRIKDEQEEITVYIAVPRVVEKYYFRISGSIYSAMYQIVDASTYNNSTSNSKKHSVTLKTIFMPIRVYRTSKNLKTIDGESVKCIEYLSRIFNKSLPAIKYIFAKFGYYGGLDFLGVSNCIYLSREPIEADETIYTFLSAKAENIYISVPRMLFDGNSLVQATVYTIFKALNKETTYDDLFTQEYWIKSLGLEFNNSSIEKGLSILDSLECIYDNTTKESIHLPEDKKADVYCILRWMISEFSNLKIKDNLDISTKKIRYAEYIASLYAMKISNGIYRVSDMGSRASLASIKKAINTHPMYLLGAISRCKLINYRNMVNDMDSITALKFTYKGISGIGESSSNSVPNTYRAVNISHLGRVDPDSSSASDPGMTGTLCPLSPLYDMSFSEFEEPNFWDAEFAKLLSNYKSMVGMKEVIQFKEDVLNIKPDKDQLDCLTSSLECVEQLIKPIIYMESTTETVSGVELEEGGMIEYE